MIKHAFTIMWNRKRSNALLILEIFISFIVLFAVAVMTDSIIGHSFRPLGYTYQNVFYFYVNWQESVSDTQAREKILQIQQQLEAIPEVKGVALTSNTVPFTNAGHRHELSYNGQHFLAQRWEVDENFAQVLALPIIAGRWFNRNDLISRQIPIVINNEMKNEHFSGKSPLGEVIHMEEKEYIVTGVTGSFNIGTWVNQPSGYFIQSSLLNASERPPANFLVQFKHPIDVTSYEKLEKVFAGLNKDDQWALGDAAPLDVFRKLARRSTLVPVIILGIVSGFLIINVVVGLFGILWQNINRRRTEIGLRRAVGACPGNIYFQIICEVWILATLGIVPGIILMFQLPVLNIFPSITVATYILSMAIAALIIYVLITICALYPSKLAASIQPATALHEN